MKTTEIKIFRWTLRILSAIFIVFFLFMFIGETFFQDYPENSKPMTANAIIQLSLMGLSLIGFIVAWKWELWGGILALVAFAALAIVNPMVVKPSLLLIYPATAILFIVLWKIDRNKMIKMK